MTDRRMDAIARERGFPDYQTWAAWQRHRSNSLQQPGQAPPQENNFLQRIINMIPGHPAMVLDHVRRKYNAATGQQP